MTPTLILVRHAATSLNDPSTEAIRGHSDIPISNEGVEYLRQTAIFLRDQKFPIRTILSSPLQRAMMTADIIAQEVKAKIVPSRALTPWDLGNMTGKSLKEVAPKMDYYQEYPDLEVPNGESYRTFYNRWTDGLDRMLQFAEAHVDEVLVGVVHSRNLLSLPSILGRKPIGDVPVKGGPEPGSVTRITKEDGDWKPEVIFEQKLDGH